MRDCDWYPIFGEKDVSIGFDNFISLIKKICESKKSQEERTHKDTINIQFIAQEEAKQEPTS